MASIQYPEYFTFCMTFGGCGLYCHSVRISFAIVKKGFFSKNSVSTASGLTD